LTMSPRPTWFLLSRPTPYVIHVEINRPSRLNAVFEPMWIELRDIFNNLSQDPSVRAVILSDAGDKAFTTGLDVQDCISAVERCEERVFASSILYRSTRLDWKFSLIDIYYSRYLCHAQTLPRLGYRTFLLCRYSHMHMNNTLRCSRSRHRNCG
jgi:hypothetical protein